MSTRPQEQGAEASEVSAEQRTDDGLFSGDTGTLPERTRRALLALLRGPYVSATTHSSLWRALIVDESVVRSRLHDLFLELHLHQEAGVAFIRNVVGDEVEVPAAVRSRKLTFLDTAMLLVLRQTLLTDPTGGRVIVDRDEVFEQLLPFRTPDRDEADFQRRLNASWKTMQNALRVLKSAERGSGGERMEISPVLRVMLDAEQAEAIAAEYRRIAEGGRGVPGAPGPAGGSDGSEGEHS